MSLTSLLGGRRLGNNAARESRISWAWDGSRDTGIRSGNGGLLLEEQRGAEYVVLECLVKLNTERFLAGVLCLCCRVALSILPRRDTPNKGVNKGDCWLHLKTHTKKSQKTYTK